MRSFGSTFIAGALGVLVGAAFVGGIVWATDDDGGGGSNGGAAVVEDSSQETSGAGSGVPAAAGDLTQLYEDVRPSVVRITTGEIDDDPFFELREGLGSGVVIDDDGHIITNYHVVRGFDEVNVTFSDGTVVEAEVVGDDPGNDIALVKVNPDDLEGDVLRPARLGDSGDVRVGSMVAAVGNPFGLDGSFTTGVISGLNRTLTSSSNGRPIRGLLQTDTAINPGNSGGALFNLEGEVIGINTAIENPGGGGFAGVGYAVPINTPKRFLTQLVSGESIDHPRLGISGRTLSPAEAADLGVDHGVAVIAVDPGSGADDAGLESSSNGEGDVITAIDGNPMRTFEDLADYIDSKNVGDEITLTVRRDGESIELTAELRSWDSSA
jgi:putative serine protease PepD